MTDWRPTATRATLETRARMLAIIRRFFADRGVLEVDTPIVVNAPVTDVHVHSARVTLDEAQSGDTYFLHTSPEYAMKRLLASGSGDIFQICHVVRGFERGRLHNSEFALIEWYRVGFSLEQLMDEVETLVREVLTGAQAGSERGGLDAASAVARVSRSRSAQSGPVAQRLAYRDVFLQHLQTDPLTVSDAELARLAGELGYQAGPCTGRDEYLDFLMGAAIGPRLGAGSLVFVHGYPASQAALARIDPADPRTALRFELYCDGVELANGFHELSSAAQQRQRFESDLAERRRLGLPVYPLDERLLTALASGLPDCAGVALGFDRLLMLATRARSIDEVLAFPTQRA